MAKPGVLAPGLVPGSGGVPLSQAGWKGQSGLASPTLQPCSLEVTVVQGAGGGGRRIWWVKLPAPPTLERRRQHGRVRVRVSKLAPLCLPHPP